MDNCAGTPVWFCLVIFPLPSVRNEQDVQHCYVNLLLNKKNLEEEGEGDRSAFWIERNN